MTDAEEFEDLYRQYGVSVLAYLHRRAQRDVANDVAADTWVVAWRRRVDLPEDPLPWLLATARRQLANARRGAQRRTRLQERISRLHGPADDTAGIGGAIASTAIAAGLAALTEEDRELLQLVAWDGLTPSQAATVLGCTPNAARVRLYRARQRLSVELQHVETASTPLDQGASDELRRR